MKKYLTVFLMLFVINCNQNQIETENIKGTWILHDVKTNQIINHQQQYNKALKQLIQTTSLSFSDNNQISGTIWGDTTFGIFSIKEDTLIVLDRSIKKQFKAKIIKLNYHTLILKETNNQTVVELTFKKSD